MYGSDAITILDNCDSYVYLGGNNIDTAKSISIRLNVPVNEVLHMPVGREIVFRRGQQPVVTVRCLSGRGLPADHERVPGGGTEK